MVTLPSDRRNYTFSSQQHGQVLSAVVLGLLTAEFLPATFQRTVFLFMGPETVLTVDALADFTLMRARDVLTAGSPVVNNQQG